MASTARPQRDQRIVERCLRGDPIADIAVEEGVCIKTIGNVVRRHGVPPRRPSRQVRNARIVRRYAAGEKLTVIAADEGVNRPYVRAVAKRAGLPPRVGWQRRYPLDEAAFDEPTAIGWWLIGLLAADGCISERDHRVSLTPRAADADVLRAFLAYVGAPDRPLTNLDLSAAAAARAWPRAAAQEARVFSAQLCRALARHGVVAGKSRRLVFSPRAAEEPAVWLGMFDGDGSGGATRRYGRPRINWYGTPAVMAQCAEFWRVTLGLSCSPAMITHRGGLSSVALFGATAARAARVLLAASPVSHQRKRLALDEIANYRSSGRKEPVL